VKVPFPFPVPDADGRRPLQSPLLQVLKAHCALLEQAALKFPHLAINPALLAQHWTPAAHWLGFASGSQMAPRGRELVAGAVTVIDDGGGLTGELVAVIVTGGDTKEEVDRKPLQSPCCKLQVLNAHCWSLVQAAWKFPHRGWSMEFVA